MSNPSNALSPEQRAELLKEYELRQSAVQSLESTVWQTSAAIGLGAIGSLIVVANRPAHKQPPWQIAAILGFLVFLASLIWWFMARRWWSIQHAMFMRMRHIEEDLSLYGVRYVRYLDEPNELSQSDLPQDRTQELKQRAESHTFLCIHHHQRAGVQRFLWLFPFAVLLAWGAYTAWLMYH